MAKKRYHYKRRKSISISVPVPSMPSMPKVNGLRLARKSKKMIRGLGQQSAKGGIAVTAAAKRSRKLFRTLNPQSTKGRLVVTAVLAIAAIASLAVYLNSFYGPPGPDGSPGPVQRMRIVTEVVPGNISNEDYFLDPGRYSDSQVNAMGMLFSKSVASPGSGIMSVYSYYLLDDFGRKMNLTGLNAQQQALFPANGSTTQAVYDVIGTIRLRYEGFSLQVIDISPSQRPQVEVTRQVPVWEMSALRLFF